MENMKARAEEMGVRNLSGRQGDSHCQGEMYPDTKFDLIFGCNLIDRLHSPSSWVTQSKVGRVSCRTKSLIHISKMCEMLVCMIRYKTHLVSSIMFV